MKVVLLTAAIPVIIKQSKPLAKKIGNEVVKFGEWLKEGSDEPVASTESVSTPDAAQSSESATASEAPKPRKPRVSTTKPTKGAAKTVKAKPRSKKDE